MRRGFFDLENRHNQLEALGGPLPKLNQIVDWESVRPVLGRIPQGERKSNAGRKPYYLIMMLKVQVLQHLYNQADEKTEYQLRDRRSFCRFLGLTPVGRVPDARTIWLFREALKENNRVDEVCARPYVQINTAGYLPRQGQIVDASMVSAQRRRTAGKTVPRSIKRSPRAGKTNRPCAEKTTTVPAEKRNMARPATVTRITSALTASTC